MELWLGPDPSEAHTSNACLSLPRRRWSSTSLVLEPSSNCEATRRFGPGVVGASLLSSTPPWSPAVRLSLLPATPVAERPRRCLGASRSLHPGAQGPALDDAYVALAPASRTPMFSVRQLRWGHTPECGSLEARGALRSEEVQGRLRRERLGRPPPPLFDAHSPPPPSGRTRDPDPPPERGAPNALGPDGRRYSRPWADLMDAGSLESRRLSLSLSATEQRDAASLRNGRGGGASSGGVPVDRPKATPPPGRHPALFIAHTTFQSSHRSAAPGGPDLADSRPPTLARISAESVTIWPSSAQFQATRAQVWPHLIQLRSTSAEDWSQLTDSGQNFVRFRAKFRPLGFRPESGRFRAHFGPVVVEIGQRSVDFGPNTAQIGRI